MAGSRSLRDDLASLWCTGPDIGAQQWAVQGALAVVIREWLSQLGLGQYESAFVAHGVDLDVLRHLTIQDLDEIGIKAVGHRRKIATAIEALRKSTEPSKLGAADDSSPPESLPHATAERRQLTVVFCDLVGSTSLASSMDPEDFRQILHSFHQIASDCFRSFGGFVDQYLGDGILAYFGYPAAQEDDATRAVGAALAIVNAIAQSGLPTMKVRIGISTGLVILGDISGRGAKGDQNAVGETPNLAARLQALAPTNSILISSSTKRIVGKSYEFDDFGSHPIKGLSEPVEAWRVTGVARGVSRIRRAHREHIFLSGKNRRDRSSLEKMGACKRL